MQLSLLDCVELGAQSDRFSRPPQLLKWIGNKYRSALDIVRQIPREFNRYFEPFVGTGMVLGTLRPRVAVAGDTLRPLIDMWHAVQSSPDELIEAYAERWREYQNDPDGTYERIRQRYNESPNRDDLVFISRTCYGGVMRFTREGKISTPRGPHKPIRPDTFAERVREWHERVKGTTFLCQDFEETMAEAKSGDVVYCDPPYVYTQNILYGSQDFDVQRLFVAIEACVRRGAKVLLSIDGFKKSGRVTLDIDLPPGLFKRELLIRQGSSMLRRFQKEGETMVGEDVAERLLLSW